jgi:L-ribulose-5-phosphate 4-epimerase
MPCRIGEEVDVQEREGVVKFQLSYIRTPPLPSGVLGEVNAWRKVLYLLGLIGRNAGRYEGLGYGNISRRINPSDRSKGEFVISGTQTGGIPDLDESHYAVVLRCDPEQNRVIAEGPVPPSSEALTHGILYSLDESIHCVMHVHSPEIWRSARSLGLPVTSEDAPYGSVEMVGAIRKLLIDPEMGPHHALAMGGHEDGILSFGRTARDAGMTLLDLLIRSFQMEKAG